MTCNRVGLVFAALTCGFVAARGAAAQSRFPVSVDVGAGVAVSNGGTYAARDAAALDALVAYPVRQTPAGGTLVAGVTLGAQTPIDHDCDVLVAAGICAPRFPVFYSAGALLGVQHGSARTASVRFMVGPVYYIAEAGGGAPGVRGLLDVATPPRRHTALVASLRHSALPSFRGEAVGISSFTLGVRIQ